MDSSSKGSRLTGALGALVPVCVTVAVLAASGSSGPPEGATAKGDPGSPIPRHGSPAEIWAVGDGADGADRSIAMAREIEQNDPDRFLYLGDVYPHGTASDFANKYAPVYGRFDSIGAPTPGNHEWGNRATGYFPYWENATGVASMPSWYAFRAAGWQLISLNSETPAGVGSDQLRWLRRTLRETPHFGNCRLAFWHRPRYSAGGHSNDRDYEPFWDALRRRARIVVNGHDHSMQRYRARRGLIQFISGAGGHDPDSVNPDKRGLRFHNDSTQGALRLRLRPQKFGFAFVSTGGRLLDAGTRRCRR